MVATISHEKLLSSPYIPKTVVCHVCGESHEVKDNGTGLQYIKCPKNNQLYLVGLGNRDIREALKS